jgi:hypothetical protein
MGVLVYFRSDGRAIPERAHYVEYWVGVVT